LATGNFRRSAPPVIAVIGGGQCSQDDASLAEAVGREIALHGATVICGGLGGIMKSTCKGAAEAGGMTVGVIPGDSTASANEYVRVPVATGLGHSRNFIVVQSADAVIAIDGDYGTLSEIAIALKSGIPVIGLNTWSIVRAGKEDSLIMKANSAAEAVELAMKSINKIRRKLSNER